MRTVRFAMLAAVVLAATQIPVYGQTIRFDGNVLETYSITNGTTNNGPLAEVVETFVAAIGQNSLTQATPVMRLRSNAGYKLSAAVGSLSGIGEGKATVTSLANEASAIQIGDIGFGIFAIDQDGASVVKTPGVGELPATRTDLVAVTAEGGPDFNYATKQAVDGRMTTNPFAATLYDIAGAGAPILSGPRISASGDNSSTDNFLGVSLKFGYLPQYFTPGVFHFTVTLTIASST